MATDGTILVVDDEPELRDMLEEYLSRNNFNVLTADGAQAARRLAAAERIELALVDVRMPGEDGLSLARHLRAHTPMSLIMLTAAGEVVDRIVGLELGADDYISKPFDPRELLARVRSVLRRTSAPAAARMGEGRVRFGPCVLDMDSHRLYGENGEEVPLTSMEFDLLRAFAANPNRVLTRDQILNATQNRDWDPFDRSVDIRIARLRKKLEPDPEKPRVIKTIRGGGYMFSTLK